MQDSLVDLSITNYKDKFNYSHLVQNYTDEYHGYHMLKCIGRAFVVPEFNVTVQKQLNKIIVILSVNLPCVVFVVWTSVSFYIVNAHVHMRVWFISH